MEKRLSKELVKARKSLKKKFQSLKQATMESQSQIEQTYKPIIRPLQEIVSTIGEIKYDKVKEEPYEFEEFTTPKRSHYQTSTPTKQQKEKTGKTPILPSEMPSFLESSMPWVSQRQSLSHRPSVSQLPSVLETSVLAETSPQKSLEDLNVSEILEQTRLTARKLVDSAGYNEYLSSFDPLPRKYIDEGIRDTEDLFDHHYGIIHDNEAEKFYLGLTQKPVEIVGKDIKIEGITYPGTTGLYELLFKKQPKYYSVKDLDNYMDILTRTNAYRRNADPNEQVQANRSYKYTQIIAPYLQQKGITKTKNISSRAEMLQSAFSRPRPPYFRHRKGSGLILKENKSNTDYVYWDDINELVDRLRLLVASTAAGHSGHNNEIISIIEELREANVIV